MRTGMEGEQVVLQSQDGTLTVTTHRVRHVTKRTGSAKFTSIMLEAVTSCEVTHTSYPALIAVAVIAFLAGLALSSSRDATPSVYGGVVAAILVGLYFLMRRQVVRLSSPSAHIEKDLAGISFDQATGVVDAVESAK